MLPDIEEQAQYAVLKTLRELTRIRRREYNPTQIAQCVRIQYKAKALPEDAPADQRELYGLLRRLTYSDVNDLLDSYVEDGTVSLRRRPMTANRDYYLYSIADSARLEEILRAA